MCVLEVVSHSCVVLLCEYVGAGEASCGRWGLSGGPPSTKILNNLLLFVPSGKHGLYQTALLVSVTDHMLCFTLQF